MAQETEIDPTIGNPEKSLDSSESGDKPEVPKSEEQICKELNAWVKRCREYKEPKSNLTYIEQISLFRDYVAGRQFRDNKPGESRANLIQAFMKRSVSRVYARDPQISITPQDFVDPQDISLLRKFGRTSEILINHLIRKVRFNRKAKIAVRAAKTSRIGAVKVVLQSEIEKDPIILDRIHDAQDNLESLKGLRDQIDHPEDAKNDDHHQGMIEKAQHLVEALKAKVEVEKATGFAIQNTKPENLIFDPLCISNLDEIDNSPRLGEVIPMTHEMAVSKFGLEKVKRMSKHSKDTTQKPNDKARGESESKANEEVYLIYEIWDRTQMTVYTISHDGNEYLKEPYRPQNTGEQWYPWFLFGFNFIDGELMPLSDVDLTKYLQDEINESRTRFREIRDRSHPFWVGNKADFQNDDEIEKVSTPDAFEVMLVAGDPQKPAKDLLQLHEPPPVNPIVYDTQDAERLMEKVSSGGEASQPKNNKSGTLGEAEILTGDLQQDNSSDNDEIEDWFGRIAEYIWQISLMVYTPEQVEDIVGPGAVWPAFPQSRKEAYNQMRLVVQPGSSGKPDKLREQNNFKTTMPVIQAMIDQWAAYVLNEQDEIAEVQKKLIQEALRRTDEKIDVDELFPKQAENEEQAEADKQAQKEQAIQAQNEQLEKEKIVFEAEIQKLQAEVDKLKADTIKVQAETDKAESETMRNLSDIEQSPEKLKLEQGAAAASIASTAKQIMTPDRPQQPN